MNDDVCIASYRKKTNKWLMLWDRWKFIDLHIKPWLYWRGNFSIAPSFIDGLLSNITLWSPFLNRIIHWKYRNHRLDIPLTFEQKLTLNNRNE